MADGSVTIEVTLTKDQLEKGLKNLKSTINSTLPSASATLKNFSNDFESLGKVATGAGKVLSTTATAGIAALGVSTAKTAIEFLSLKENTATAFKVLLGSTEDAQKMLDDLYTFAKTTPFSYSTYLSTSKSLLSMGISAQKVIPYLEGITNAAIATGKGEEAITSISQALGKMTTQTKLSLEGMYMISDQGIPVFKILGNQLGKTTAEVMDLISSGKMASDEMIPKLIDGMNNGTDGVNGMTAAFAGLAGETKGNLSGLLDSLKSAFKNMSMEVWNAETSYNSLKDVVKSFTDIIRNLAPVFQSVSTSAKPFLDNLAQGLNKIAEYLKSANPEQLKKIGDVILGLAGAGPILLGVGKGFDAISKGFSVLSTGAGIIESFNGKISKITSAMLGWISNNDKLKTNIGGLVTSGISSLNTAVSGLGSKIPIISSLGSSVSGIAGKFSSAFPQISGFFGNVTNGFSTMFENIIPKLTSFAPMFMKAFNITAVVGLVVAGLGLLQSNFGDQINQMLDTAITKGPEIITNLANGIVSKLPELLSKGGELLGKLIDTIIANLPAIIQAGFQIIGALVLRNSTTIADSYTKSDRLYINTCYVFTR